MQARMFCLKTLPAVQCALKFHDVAIKVITIVTYAV